MSDLMARMALASRTAFDLRNSVGTDEIEQRFRPDEMVRTILSSSTLTKSRLDEIHLKTHVLTSVERRTELMRQNNEHLLVFDFGFLYQALLLVRCARLFHMASKEPRHRPNATLCSAYVFSIMEAEVAFLRGDFSLTLGIIERSLHVAKSHIPKQMIRWVCGFEKFDAGDMEMTLWCSIHILMHELGHLHINGSFVSDSKRQLVVNHSLDQLHRMLGKMDAHRYEIERAMRCAGLDRGMRAGDLESAIDGRLRKDREFLGTIRTDSYLADEIYGDRTAIDEHYMQLIEQYKAKPFDSNQAAVAILARPMVIQLIIFYVTEMRKLAEASLYERDHIELAMKLGTATSMNQSARLWVSRWACSSLVHNAVEELSLDPSVAEDALDEIKAWCSYFLEVAYSGIPDGLSKAQLRLSDALAYAHTSGMSPSRQHAAAHYELCPRAGFKRLFSRIELS